MDIEDFTVENALFKSFDAIVRQQLDPIWHRVSQKTKQLVGDMKMLRRLLTLVLCSWWMLFLSLRVRRIAVMGIRSTVEHQKMLKVYHTGFDIV